MIEASLVSVREDLNPQWQERKRTQVYLPQFISTAQLSWKKYHKIKNVWCAPHKFCLFPFVLHVIHTFLQVAWKGDGRKHNLEWLTNSFPSTPLASLHTWGKTEQLLLTRKYLRTKKGFWRAQLWFASATLRQRVRIHDSIKTIPPPKKRL